MDGLDSAVERARVLECLHRGSISCALIQETYLICGIGLRYLLEWLVWFFFFSPSLYSFWLDFWNIEYVSVVFFVWVDVVFVMLCVKINKKLLITSALLTMILLCLIGQPTCLTWTPYGIYGIFSRERWETVNLTIQTSWRLNSASAVPQADRFHAHLTDAGVCAKGAPTKIIFKCLVLWSKL